MNHTAKIPTEEVHESTYAMLVRSRITTILLLVPAVLVMATAMSGQPAPRGTSESAAAFKQLASLVGEWQGIQDGGEIEVTFTLTANGSALMEQDQPANSA